MVSNNSFKKFSFTLYIAVNDFDELHPITLYQCDELSKAGRLRCYAKKKMQRQKVQVAYPNIQLIEDRFEGRVKK